MTLEEYEAWVQQAAPRDRVTYYVGELAKDRVRPVPHPEIAGWYLDEPVEPLYSLAARIWADYELGLVVMTQGALWAIRPDGSRQFEYYVSRTSKEL